MASLELCLSPLVSAPAEARHAIDPWLSSVGVVGSRAQDALVVVSELVTNGVLHDGGDDILVRADTVDGSLIIDVVTTPLPSGIAHHHRPNIDAAETGRGLTIVGALCQELTTTEDSSGRRTDSCRIDVGGALAEGDRGPAPLP